MQLAALRNAEERRAQCRVQRRQAVRAGQLGVLFIVFKRSWAVKRR
jgi:hypothetical protein